jgi:pimeloyl-ACP methyl ester carboxylesterase
MMSLPKPSRALVRSFLALLICVAVLNGAEAQAQTPEDAGPYAVGQRDFVVPGTSGGNANVRLRVHYPATSAGTGTPFEAQAAPCPLVIFGHGFSLPATLYDSLYAHLASHGYVVAAPRTEEALFTGNLPRFVLDFRAAVLGLRAESLSGQNGLKGALAADVRAIAAGHSFGGAAAIVAASGYESLFAGVVTMAATATSPQNVDILAAQRAMTQPVLHLGASQDSIVPPAQNLDVLYRASAAPRFFAEIGGGTHSYFHEAWYADRLLEPAGSISVAEQQRLVRRLWLPFCEWSTRGDTRFLDALIGPAAVADPGLTRRGLELEESVLFTSGEAALGKTLQLHPARAPGEIALTWISLGSAQLSTPFGDFALDPATLILLGASATNSASFGTQALPIPSDPSFSGLRLHAQSLLLGMPERLSQGIVRAVR